MAELAEALENIALNKCGDISDPFTMSRHLVLEAAAQLRAREGLLREAEGMLCDIRAGKTANELAEKIIAGLREPA